MSSIDVRIARKLQLLANEVAADLTPAAVARVTVEKTTPELTSANIEVAVGIARKVATRSPRSPSIKRAIDAALKAGASVVIKPDKSVTITGAPATGKAANEVAGNGHLDERELEAFDRRVNGQA